MATATLARPVQSTPYPFTFDEGRHSALLWASMTNPGMTLAQWREARWKVYSRSLYTPHEIRPAFDAGFERGLAQIIAGRA